MPGYDKDIFIDLSKKDYEELLCGICLDVFKDPKVVTCCRQTYCSDCINEWLLNNNKCPNDRKQISVEQLIDPPLLVQNMIMKLKIRCNYSKNGCKKVIKLEELENHMKNCKYNPKKTCEICEYTGVEQHDCLQELIIRNLSLKERVSQLETSQDFDFEKYKSNYGKHKNAVIQTALKAIKSGELPTIIQTEGFPHHMKSKLIEIIGRVLEESNQYGEIAQLINKEMSEGFWSYYVWHVIVSPKEIGDSLVRPNGVYMFLSFGDLRFEVFATNSSN